MGIYINLHRPKFVQIKYGFKCNLQILLEVCGLILDFFLIVEQELRSQGDSIMDANYQITKSIYHHNFLSDVNYYSTKIFAIF